MGVAAALALTAGSGAAQSALDRPPDLNEGWVVAPGSLQFDFLHRFTVSPAPDRKVTNSPTFLLGAGLPGRFLVGFNYATNSDVAQRYPNEWEFLGRWQPLSSDFGPLDATLEGAYNLAARSVDGALALGRAVGALRLQAEGRVLGHAYDEPRTRFALALAAFAAAALACGPLGTPAATPPPTLPAPVRWRQLAGLSVISPPALADGLLVYLTSQAQVIALDAATGAVLWQTQSPLQHPFASNPCIPPMDTEPVLASGSLIYFNVEDLIALQVP